MHLKTKYNPLLEDDLFKIPERSQFLEQSSHFDQLHFNLNQTLQYKSKHKSQRKRQKDLYCKIRS